MRRQVFKLQQTKYYIINDKYRIDLSNYNPTPFNIITIKLLHKV